jgi:hypothetical protein
VRKITRILCCLNRIKFVLLSFAFLFLFAVRLAWERALVVAVEVGSLQALTADSEVLSLASGACTSSSTPPGLAANNVVKVLTVLCQLHSSRYSSFEVSFNAFLLLNLSALTPAASCSLHITLFSYPLFFLFN